MNGSLELNVRARLFQWLRTLKIVFFTKEQEHDVGVVLNRAWPNPYLSPLIRPLFLDGYEKAARVAFLRALTDQEICSSVNAR